MKKEHTEQPENRKQGVAIVVVLGLMAVLMVAAVAFAISMRIERRGASNFRHGVQARHMLWAALVNAIEDIHSDMNNVTNFTIYPSWEHGVMGSGGGDAARVLSREAVEHLQPSLRYAHTNVTPRWRTLKIDGETRGRYSYLVYDTSGLLDINYVGGSTNRLNGADAGEMQLDPVPGITTATDYYSDRNRYVRFETLLELDRLAAGINETDNFALFSRAPVRYRIEGKNDIPQQFIGGDEDDLRAAEQDIRDALQDSGLSQREAGLAFSNLVDYVDADSNVGGVPLDHARVERFPMINEVIATLWVQHALGGAAQAAVALQVEWFYPFGTENTSTFDFDGEVWIRPGPNNSHDTLVPGSPAFAWTDLDVNGFTGGNALGPPRVMIFPPAAMGSANSTNIRLNLEITLAGRINGPDGTVDEVPAPYNPDNGITLTFDIPNITPGMTFTTNAWAECMDPRFNWKAGLGLGHWIGGTAIQSIEPTALPTPGAVNNAPRMMFDGSLPLPFDTDGDTLMHVADRPLKTVGELGNICYAPWWSTIRLYRHSNGKPATRDGGVGEPFHRVLDYFTVYSNEVEAVRGAVNLNSRYTNVLAAAFNEAPEEEFDPVGTARITWANARAIAASIAARNRPNPITRLSDLGEIVNWEAVTSDTSEIGREGPIRNTCELLTVRHNLFTVVVRAQSYSTSIGGVKGILLASSHGMAEVWRDPFPDENGNHRCFVRSFRMLEE